MTYQAAAAARRGPPRGARLGGARQVPRRDRREPDRRRRGAALRRRRVRRGDARSPCTTATRASCASAAAPTRSSWRSSPGACARDPRTVDRRHRGRAGRRATVRGGRTRCRSANAWPCCSTRAPSSRTACSPTRAPRRMPADGVITGVGRVEGRPVAVIAHDFTVKAGSWGQLTCEKQIRDPRARRPRPAAGGLPGRLRRRPAHRPDGLLPRPPRRLGDLPPTRSPVRPRAADLLPARPVGRRRRLHARVLRLGRHGRAATGRCTWPARGSPRR